MILFHAPNRIGLGHINRLAAIALAIQEIDSSIKVPFVIEGASHILLDVLNLPHVPLPSTHTMDHGPAWDAWGTAERAEIQLSIARVVLKSLRPGLVVFDCFPTVAFARAAVEFGSPIVLCLRAMKDLERYLRLIRDLIPHLTGILVPHEPGAFNLPPELMQKSRFVGQIARSTNRRPCPRSESTRIVITGGGGGDPHTVDFYNLALQALVCARDAGACFEARLIAGPLFQDWEQLNVVGGVRIVPFDSDMPGTLACAGIVICQAGYNTIAELAQLDVKTICVPGERKYDDQFARAEGFAMAADNVRLLKKTNAESLAELILELMPMKVVPVRKPTPQGARVAGEYLCRLLRTPKPTSFLETDSKSPPI